VPLNSLDGIVRAAVFGCGEAGAPGALGFGAQVAEAAFGQRADRLLNSGAFDLDALDWARRLRREARAWLLGGVGLLGLLAPLPMSLGGAGGAGGPGAPGGGRVHTVPSTPETVRLGVLDATLPNLLEIDSGDVIVYPDTWSHFLNRLQPGLAIDDIAR